MKRMGLSKFLCPVIALTIFVLTSTATHAQEPMKVRINIPGSPTGVNTLAGMELFRNIETLCKGKVEMSFYTGTMLGPPTESYNMVKSGMVDISACVLGFFPGQFPLCEVMSLPFLGPSDAEVGSRVHWGLYEKFPEFKAQFQGVRVLQLYTDVPCIIGTNRPIQKVEDLKGLKMRVITEGGTEMIKRVGAMPVSIAPPEAYTAMERKVIDGWVWTWEGAISHKLDELTQYYTVVATYMPAFAFVMSPNTWNKLPPDVQGNFDKWSGDAGSAFLGKGMDGGNEKGKARIEADKSKKISVLPPEEVKKWKETCKPIWEKWVSGVESKSLPGRAVLEESLRLKDKFAAEKKK